MYAIKKLERNMAGLEYKNVTVSRDMEGMYADGYASFGWELERTTAPLTSVASVCMKFKRNRKIGNRMELTRLQRQFDSLMNEIASLERSKETGASVTAYIIGVVATVVMAGSVLAFLGGALPLCVILSVVGLAGWVLSYFCFQKVQKSRTIKVAPFIEQKYNEVYAVCEKAHSLLAW